MKIHWIVLLFLSVSTLSFAAEPENQPAYIEMRPDIITNYVTDSSTLGFIRVTISLMIEKKEDLSKVEHHLPLLRNAIIQILGTKSKQQVRNISGRDSIRNECLVRVNELLVRETGAKLVKELIFTKYLYQ